MKDLLGQSERKIMAAIKHAGPIARSEITRQTELAQADSASDCR